MAVNLFDWTQYPIIQYNNKTYRLIQNIDDNLCLGIDATDTLTDDESVLSVMPLYAILIQLDGVTVL